MDDSIKFSEKKAKDAVFRLLKFRLRSEKELNDRLTQKGFSAEVIKAVIGRLIELELVDDRKYAKELIIARLKRPFGINRIRVDLIKRGIGKEIIEEELANIKDSESEAEIVKELTQKRILKYQGIEREKVKQRIYGYLTRRGFSNSAIIKAIKDI